ncbi:hypothetical protein GEMRC1_000860 [Eukaryota sp. GEM-RC1]
MTIGIVDVSGEVMTLCRSGGDTTLEQIDFQSYCRSLDKSSNPNKLSPAEGPPIQLKEKKVQRCSLQICGYQFNFERVITWYPPAAEIRAFLAANPTYGFSNEASSQIRHPSIAGVAPQSDIEALKCATDTFEQIYGRHRDKGTGMRNKLVRIPASDSETAESGDSDQEHVDPIVSVDPVPAIEQEPSSDDSQEAFDEETDSDDSDHELAAAILSSAAAILLHEKDLLLHCIGKIQLLLLILVLAMFMNKNSKRNPTCIEHGLLYKFKLNI